MFEEELFLSKEEQISLKRKIGKKFGSYDLKHDILKTSWSDFEEINVRNLNWSIKCKTFKEIWNEKEIIYLVPCLNSHNPEVILPYRHSDELCLDGGEGDFFITKKFEWVFYPDNNRFLGSKEMIKKFKSIYEKKFKENEKVKVKLLNKLFLKGKKQETSSYDEITRQMTKKLKQKTLIDDKIKGDERIKEINLINKVLKKTLMDLDIYICLIETKYSYVGEIKQFDMNINKVKHILKIKMTRKGRDLIYDMATLNKKDFGSYTWSDMYDISENTYILFDSLHSFYILKNPEKKSFTFFASQNMINKFEKIYEKFKQ